MTPAHGRCHPPRSFLFSCVPWWLRSLFCCLAAWPYSSSSTNRAPRTLAGTGIGARTLAAYRQATTMTQTAIAAKIHQPFNAHVHFASQITFNPDVINRLAQLLLLTFGKVPDFGFRGDTGCAAYFKSAAAPDSVNMCQSHPDMRSEERRVGKECRAWRSARS